MAVYNGKNVLFGAQVNVTEMPVDVVQTTGDSETVVMSQKAVTKNLDAILSAFELSGGTNLLNPENAESGYYENSSGVLVENSGGGDHIRTITPISVVGVSNLWFASIKSDTDKYVSVLYLDESGAVISQVSFGFSSAFTIKKEGVPSGAVSVHIWVSGVKSGLSFTDLCVSASEITEYEQYGAVKTPRALKEDFLPDISESVKQIAILYDSVEKKPYFEGSRPLELPYEQKGLANNGELYDTSQLDTTDFISITDTYQVYLTATNGAKYGHKNIAYYDKNKQYISGSLKIIGTNYEFTEIDGKPNSFAYPINAYPDASYVRISISREYPAVKYTITPYLTEYSLGNASINMQSITALNEEIDEIKEALSEEKEGYGFEQDATAFEGVEMLEGTTTTAGSIWDNGGKLVSTQYTTSYTAINELLAVTPNDELRFEKGGYFLVYGFEADGNTKAQGQVIVDASTKDTIYIVPDGCYKIGISYRYTTSPKIYRLTPTVDEAEALPVINKNFTIKVENLKDKQIKMLLSPLKDKVIVNFGDSIFGNYRPPEDVSTFISNYTGATVYNCGFGGCRMASHSIANFDAFSMYNLATSIASQNFAVQDTAIEAGKTATTEGEGKLPSYFEETLATLKSIDFSKVDIITIAYGTNDFAGNKSLDNDGNLYDTTRFAGALRHSIETILSAYPHIRIFVCSQIYRFWMDSAGAFTEDSDAKTYSAGHKLTDFVAKTKEVAKAYHLPFIDNYYELGLNKFNRTIYFPATDGTHPNAIGRELLARHIAKELF